MSGLFLDKDKILPQVVKNILNAVYIVKIDEVKINNSNRKSNLTTRRRGKTRRRKKSKGKINYTPCFEFISQDILQRIILCQESFLSDSIQMPFYLDF